MTAEQSTARHRCTTVDPSGTEDAPPKPVRDRVRRGIALYRIRGYEIAEIAPSMYLVPGCSTLGSFYRVDLRDETCSCPDSTGRSQRCKHVFAAMLHAARRATRERGATPGAHDRRCAGAADPHPKRAPTAA